MITYFTKTAENLPEYVTAEKAAKNNPLPTMVTGISHIHKAHLLAKIATGGLSKPLLVLAKSESDASRLVSDINTMSGAEISRVYPSKDLMLGDVEAASNEYEHKRLDVLYRLMTGVLPVAVATPEAASQLTVPKDVLSARSIILEAGSEVNLEKLAKRLIKGGFSRCDQIEGVSQFSIRGAIIDIFPINSALPVRVELWGDEIDSISYFDLETQRRGDKVKRVEIAPATELLFDSDEKLVESIEELAGKLKAKNADDVKKHLYRDANRIKGGVSVGSDKYFPLCYENPASLFDYVSTIIVSDNAGCNENIRTALSQHAEDLKILFEEAELCRGLDRFMLTKAEYSFNINAKTRLYLENFLRGGGLDLGEMIPVTATQLSLWSGEYAVLKEQLEDYISRDYSVIVFAGTEKAARTLTDDLKNDKLPAEYSQSPSKPAPRKITVTEGMLSAGYDYPDAKYACISHTAVTSIKKSAPKRKKAEIINSLNDIAVGDLVVHNTYGIGVFEGVTKLTQDKISKDYIKIKYAGTDVLYVPVTQLDLISRYIGSADLTTVKLSKMHTDQWQKAKAKAKTAAKEMAQELTELYAKRLKSEGYAFAPDGEEQESFENHFNYVETDDQMRCIAEIKHDMQRNSPMDRLLCGDVGFGKTEVALRGAFKCLMEGKQCALLCPTTVLAWQHYQTVLKRMEGFPVRIELLSRFRSPKEQKKILEQLKKGSVDMVIGTHRLVQKDVEFKDLGLVIIDEEQRFGVAHKERFKEMFSGVDILTLSATPIPRTLNMAMTGIRDMSVIETPPQDRQPITTYVLEHDWGVLAQAIYKELRRGGQIYYIHNRIESITTCAAKIHELVPEARIGIAHGQMSEDELLEVWSSLLDGEIDILVCTTLIETGVDVPNCNTLIIENADNMGLAQLHQLRGRVGRTNKRAFAYFTFKRGKVLSEIATKRLNAIREFTKFGSGFRIAMRDLEIRGAGSILGASQSGHLTAVGYDMYLKLLNEAVDEQNGKPEVKKEECLVDIKINAYIPEDYISNAAQRIACYRKIAMIRTKDDAMDVTDELIDRYGDVPKSVYGLIEVAQLRNIAEKVGVTEIVQNNDIILFYIERPDMKKVAQLNALLDGRVNLNLTGKTSLKVKVLDGEQPLEVMGTVLKALDGEEEKQ